jgi:hypothetical protein
MCTYYAADNHYGSETDIGFANTWYVISFASKVARDAYVANSNKRSTRAIKAREVRQYGGVSRRMSADGIIDHAH